MPAYAQRLFTGTISPTSGRQTSVSTLNSLGRDINNTKVQSGFWSFEHDGKGLLLPSANVIALECTGDTAAPYFFLPVVKEDGNAATLTIAGNQSPTTFRKTVNAGVAYTDYTAAVTDGNAATHGDLSALDTLANGDWAVAGYSTPFAKLYIDMSADAGHPNSTASVMAVHYWNGAWTAVSGLVDGTQAPAGTTLGQDGAVTWTMPTDWVANTIDAVEAYHVRLTFSAALDASVMLDEVYACPPMRYGIFVRLVPGAVRYCINVTTPPAANQSYTGCVSALTAFSD